MTGEQGPRLVQCLDHRAVVVRYRDAFGGEHASLAGRAGSADYFRTKATGERGLAVSRYLPAPDTPASRQGPNRLLESMVQPGPA